MNRRRTPSPLPLSCWLIAAAAAGQTFETIDLGFRHEPSRTSRKYLPETMGSGVALLDYDGDGRLDVFFVNGARLADPMPPGARPAKSDPRHWNRLYRNLGDWRFEDATEAAGLAGRGYGMGAAVGDFDNDGDPDLFVSNVDRDELWRNDGPDGFRDVTTAAGVGGEGWSSGAAFFDFDRDGRLDLFVARYLDWAFNDDRACGEFLPERRSYCHPRLFGAVAHRLYRNLGEGRFEDVSAEVGLDAHPGKGLGVALGDFDDDGWTDVFVANDSAPGQLFRNVEGRRLAEVAVSAGVAYDADGREYAGMGVAWADANRDGRADLLVNALGRQGYWLYRASEAGFETASESSGLAALTELRSGWGIGLVDFDNDGWLDLLVAQGHVMDDIGDTDPALAHREPLLLARNLFGRFYDVSGRAGPAFEETFAGRGAAFGDLDGDGRIDTVVSVNGGAGFALRNTTESAGGAVTVRLAGAADNRDGIGARVTVVAADGVRQTAMRSNAGGYLSSGGGADLHFGLGDAACEEIHIRWPNGAEQTVAPCSSGLIEIVQPGTR